MEDEVFVCFNFSFSHLSREKTNIIYFENMAAEASEPKKGEVVTVQDPPADWMEKLPPHIRDKVNAVVYEGWPKEQDLMTVNGEPNQTQGLISECGKAVSASWSPTKTFVAVGSPESWGVIASVTAPAGWALMGRDTVDPEYFTLVTNLNSLTEDEKKKIKDGTAKTVNSAKFYASEEGLADIVEKSTPWVKRVCKIHEHSLSHTHVHANTRKLTYTYN